MKRLPIVLTAMILVSCTTAQFAPSVVTSVFPPRTPPEAIELFRSAAPTRKYTEIGTASACCSGDANAIIELLRKKAADSGGDALIGLELSARGGATATVIRFQ